MAEMLSNLVHMLLEVLRKLWQRLTGRVPVPVRVRRFSPLDGGDSFSRSSVNGSYRTVADEFNPHR